MSGSALSSRSSCHDNHDDHVHDKHDNAHDMMITMSMVVNSDDHDHGRYHTHDQGCINRVMYSHPELTLDHVLTTAYVIIF